MKTKILLLAGAGLAIAHTPAVAQAPVADAAEVNQNQGDIIVTANKRDETLKDVPISVSVLGSAELEAGMIEKPTDYFQFVPNVGIRSQGNQVRTFISIRGISYIGGDKATSGFYVDELNITPTADERAKNIDLSDVERIEVLRGPQGTTFGRSTIGGAISITTKKPTDKFEGDISGEYGSFDTWKTRAMVNIPIAEGIAARVSGVYGESDGFIDNIGPSAVGDRQRNRAFNAALRLKPSEPLTIDLAYRYYDFRQNSQTAVPTGIPAPNRRTRPIIQEVPFYPANTDTISTDFPNITTASAEILSGRMEYDFGGVSLISVTGYVDSKAFDRLDSDQTSLSISASGAKFRTKVFSQELRLQSNGDGPISWVGGLMYSADSFGNGFVDLCGADGGCTGPTYEAQFPGYELAFDGAALNKTKAYAAFAEVVYRPVERLSLTLGGRFSHEKGRFRITRDIGGLGGYDTGLVIRSKTDDFSPRFTAAYEVTDDSNIYATVSKGYKPGGADPFSPGQPPYGKETAWNYEAGFKSNLFDRRAFISASAFYLKWKDMQVLAEDESITGFAEIFTLNASAASVKGFEIEVDARPVDGLSLTGAVGYSDAKFDRFEDAFVVGQADPSIDISGTRLPMSSKWTTSATAQYDFPITDSVSAFVRGEYSYTSNFNIEVGGNALVPETRVPGFDKVNLRIGIETGPVSIVGFVENLFDSDYILGLRASGSFRSGVQAVTDPRRFGARVAFKF